MARVDVVGLGSCLVDYFALVPDILRPEQKVSVHRTHVEAGGVTANNLVQLARLGASAGWFGKIGDDANGRVIMDAFVAEGMDTTQIETVPGAESAITWIPVDSRGGRSIYMFPNVTATITGADIRTRYRGYIEQARALHTEICQLPLDPIIAALEIAREAGVTTVVDFDVDPKLFFTESHLGTEAQLERVLALTDVLKPAESAATALTGASDPDVAARRLLGYGPSTVALTLGEAGSVLATADRVEAVPAFSVPVVDTTGAGDAYMGGLSYSLLQGWPLKEVGRFANACGAFCCTKVGARQMGTLAEVTALMAR